MKAHGIRRTLRRIDFGHLTADSLRQTIVVADLRSERVPSHTHEFGGRRRAPRRAPVDEVSGVMPMPIPSRQAHALPLPRGLASGTLRSMASIQRLLRTRSEPKGHIKMNAKPSIVHRTVRTVVVLVAAVLLLLFLIHGAAS